MTADEVVRDLLDDGDDSTSYAVVGLTQGNPRRPVRMSFQETSFPALPAPEGQYDSGLRRTAFLN